MTELRALAIGADLARRVATPGAGIGRGGTLASHRSSGRDQVYLCFRFEIDGELYWVDCRADHLSPRTALVEEPLRIAAFDEPISVGHGRVRSASFELVCTVPPTELAVLGMQRSVDRVRAGIARLEAQASGEPLTRRYYPGFEERLESFVADAWQSRSPARSAACFSGLGDGSTPTADDFVGGFALGGIALGWFDPVGSEECDMFRALTTPLAVAHLRCHLVGTGSRAEVSLVRAVVGGDLDGIDRHRPAVAGSGASSGRAFLAGLTRAIQAWLGKENVW